MTQPSRAHTLTGGVAAPVEIRWDTWGAPHITAHSRHDLFFAQGYVTALEHLWRLEYCRRQARGELAALLGADALASDKEMRTLGLGAHADDLAARLPDDEREVLDAYAAGVNAWVARATQHSHLPVELELLGIESVEPWTPADSIACWKHRWWTLTGRLQNIAIGEAARRYLPSDLHDAFMATELGEETIIPGDRDGGTVSGGADSGEGSNNWVVAGRRTTTGHPVLCSDPHNPFGQPGQWLEVQLALADGSFDVIGPSYIGWPGVYMGRNRTFAWGFTNHVASARDLYVEDVDEAHPGCYGQDGSWRNFTVERHEIRVRGGAPVAFEVRRTPRGPVFSHLLPNLGGQQQTITLRWTGTEVGSGLKSLLALDAAVTAADGVEALRTWPCSVVNAMMADAEDNIAYHVAGFVPRVPEAARRYRSAQDPADQWQGYLPYEALPNLINPARGWLASANQPPWVQDPPGLSYLPGAAWADGGRMRRIRERLTEQETHSAEQLGSIQADILSVRARELVPALLRLLDQGEATALDALRAWDYRYATDTIAPTIWTAWWDRWLRRVVSTRFPSQVISLVAAQAGAVARQALLEQETAATWLGGTVAEVAARDVWRETLEWLASQFGDDPTGWTWGRVHTVTWEHPLALHGPAELRARAVEQLNVGPFPTSGGPTVRAAGMSAARPYAVTGGATYRLVVDMSAGGGLHATSTTGNSGWPGSPHYADQAPLWVEDRYRLLPMGDFEPEAVTHLAPNGR